MKDTTDPVSFVREAIRSALWAVSYHERALPAARRTLAFAKELIERLGIDCDEVPEAELDKDGEPVATSVDQYACDLVDGASSSVEYHETQLKIAHDHLAFATIMLARGNYTEINVAEIREQVEKEKP